MYKKGARKERELVEMFWVHGWGAVRVPASGSKSKRPYPDVIASNGLRYIALESKVMGKKALYLKNAEVRRLYEFAEIFGCEPYFAIWTGRWIFIEPNSLIQTKNGYKITQDLVVKKGIDFTELIKEG
ncbi:MAG: Holliday junction resolvase Hjc [Candidatus Hydrothermarchaeota archaeon]